MHGAGAEIRICTKCRASFREPALEACPRDGGELAPWAEDPLIGQVLGDRYQIVEPLGQGGMGSVYLAERLPDELEVAIKIIRPEHLRNAKIHERFLREVRHTSSIHSAHVVQIYDSGMSAEGRAYMVMERLDGESLTERLRHPPPLGPSEALFIARDVGRALAAAHAAGVIHRDLKPDNIILCKDGTVKVVDFGIAKALEKGPRQNRVSEPSLTEAHRVVGTPVYMAPEVISKTGLYPASDLYALGVILYEMLVGEPPFYEKDAVGTMYLHLNEQPRRLREIDPSLPIPGALETLVSDLLIKKAEERPADANDVVRRIQALRRIVRDRAQRPMPQAGGDVTKVWTPGTRDSMPEVPQDEPQREAKSNRTALLVIAAVLALVFGFGLTAGVLFLVEMSREETVELPRE